MNSYLRKTRMHMWRALRRERFRPVVELFRRTKYPRSIDSFSIAIDASEFFCTSRAFDPHPSKNNESRYPSLPLKTAISLI